MKNQFVLSRNSSITLFVCVIVLFCSTSLYPQNSKWKVYNKENSGLTITDISTITIDSKGNKWIGTDEGGLFKFDGTNWTTYNKHNSDLPDDHITAISIDSKSNIWIGTENGLAKFDETQWTIYNSKNSGLPMNEILAIAIDSLGNKWIGTNGGGLCRFDEAQWTVYNRKNSNLLENNINAIAIDSKGNKWIGTKGANGGGFYKFNGTKFISHTILSYNNGRVIIIDSYDNKWVGTHVGLYKFDDTQWTIYKKNNSRLPKNNINAVSIDYQGNKWIGTKRGGFCKFDGTKWTKYNASKSDLPDNCVRAISIDSQGNKWVGTNKGLSVFNEDGIKSLNNPVIKIKAQKTNEISTQKSITPVATKNINNSTSTIVKEVKSNKTLFSIDTITTVRNRFELNGAILKPNQLLELMKSYPEAQSEMQQAKSNYDGAMVLDCIGGFCIGFPIGQALGGGKPTWALAGVGIGLIFIATPLTSAYNRHAKTAIRLYNKKLKPNQHANKNTELYLGMTKYGYGLIYNL